MPGGRPETRPKPEASKSVSKVFDMLEYTGASQRAVSVSAIARGTAFNVSTALRQLQRWWRVDLSSSSGDVVGETGHPAILIHGEIVQLRKAIERASEPPSVLRSAGAHARFRARKDEIPRRGTAAPSGFAQLPEDAVLVVFQDVTAEDWYVDGTTVGELEKIGKL